MKTICPLLLPVLVVTYSMEMLAQKKTKLSANKQQVINSINNAQEKMIEMSDKIWAFAETAFNETQSAQLLMDYAESQGFKVKKAVAGTAHGVYCQLWIGETCDRHSWGI